MVWRVEKTPASTERAATLAAEVEAGRRVMLAAPGGRGKTDVLLDVTRRLGERALLVRVPTGVDQVEAVVVQMAASLGDEALRDVDASLREHVDEVEPALNVLHRRIEGRFLVVDDIDWLGPSPGDVDLDGVLRGRREALDAWLNEHAALCSSEMTVNRLGFDTQTLPPFEAPPLRLLNDVEHDVVPVWESVEGDLGRFRLALALAQIEAAPPKPRLGREDQLVESIWDALPASHREVLALLSVHARPLPTAVWQDIPAAPSTSARAQVGGLTTIVGTDGRSLWLEGPLQRFAEASLPPAEREECHLRLAAAFAGELRGDEPGGWARAGSLIEAERHYAAAGNADRALQFARYGVALLLDLARRRSRLGRFQRTEYDAAASIYESILSLPKERIGRRAWAYATHYLHYNRYKAKPAMVEPVSKTEAGYRASVSEWHENALFWSRLALTQFIQSERARALSTLQEARDNRNVPVHRRKEWYLRCRTVQHLLDFQPARVVDALHVWGHYQAKDPNEKEVEDQLRTVLSNGFSVSRLEAPNAPTLHLHRDVTVQIRPVRDRFVCSLEELAISARGEDALAAFWATTVKLRDDTERLRRAFTHMLPPDERAQKQRLLGSVDIVASGLLGTVAKSTWVLGKVVVQDDGAKVVREVGSSARTFLLGAREALDDAVVPDRNPRLVRVATGAAGEPVGPVLELDAPLGEDQDRLWQEWRRRLGEGERPHG